MALTPRRIPSALAAVLFMSTLAAADPTPPARFDFTATGAASAWSPVLDGIMGGRSEATAVISPERTLVFAGRLSLLNNGGFASIRSQAVPLGMTAGHAVRLKFRGDGRTYAMSLWARAPLTDYVAAQMEGRLVVEDLLCVQVALPTQAGVWQEVDLPCSRFTPTLMGQPAPEDLVDAVRPERLQAVGFTIADKKEGPFRLEIGRLEVVDGAF
jgi:hypothetical protein